MNFWIASLGGYINGEKRVIEFSLEKRQVIHLGELSSFYILQEYRNKGYGKKVITYLKQLFDRAKIQLWVLEDNKIARQFYEKNGFKETGKIRSIYRGKCYIQLQYEYAAERCVYSICGNPLNEWRVEKYNKMNENLLINFLQQCLPESGRILDLNGRHNFYRHIESYFIIFWCMFDEEKIIGTVAVKELDQKRCELKSLYLLESYHGRGLGQHLLEKQ